MERLLQFPNLSSEEQQEILDGPGLTPPKGVTPNLNDPENHNGVAIAVSVVCICLVTTTILIRIYSRLFIVKKWNFEDYLGLAAFAGYAGITWAFYTQLHYGGFFVRQWDVPFRDLQRVIYSAVILTIVYGLTMIFAKTAILLEWVRIFLPGRGHSGFFWGARIMMILNILLYSSGIIAESLACIPLATIWEPWLMGKCMDKKILDITTAYFNLVMDLFILLLPQTVIWKLQMSRNKKIGVSIIFSFGVLTVVSAAGRVYANQVLPYVNEGDTNYGLAQLYLWGFVEATCVILVFNIPALPKAFSDGWIGPHIVSFFQSWTQISSYKSSTGNTSGGPSTWRHAHSSAKPNIFTAVGVNSQTQLTDRERLGPSGLLTANNYGPAQQDGGIIRLTEFEARSDAASKTSNASNDTGFARQHPWMQG